MLWTKFQIDLWKATLSMRTRARVLVCEHVYEGMYYYFTAETHAEVTIYQTRREHRGSPGSLETPHPSVDAPVRMN